MRHATGNRVGSNQVSRNENALSDDEDALRRVAFNDSDFDSDDWEDPNPPSRFRASDFASGKVITSIAAALDDIDKRIEAFASERRTRNATPPDAFSPARVKKRRHEDEVSNPAAVSLPSPSIASESELGSLAKRRSKLDTPLTLGRRKNSKDTACRLSRSNSTPDIETLAHRACLERELGKFATDACAKSLSATAEALDETSRRRGDHNPVVLRLGATDGTPRASDALEGFQNEKIVHFASDSRLDERLETDRRAKERDFGFSSLRDVFRHVGDAFGLSDMPEPQILAGDFRITDQFELDLSHALETELAC
jgi:hypothetical protein